MKWRKQMNPRMFTTQDKREMLKRQDAKVNVKVTPAPAQSPQVKPR